MTPMDSSPAEAEALRELLSFRRGRQLWRIRQGRKFKWPAFFNCLMSESWAHRFSDPSLMLWLARLAANLAEICAPVLVGPARVCLANALRVVGLLQEADA